jgi:exodeoxyribonuclease-3
MRKLHPEGPLWTFWDYKFERWQKDKGIRLDHFLLSPNLSVRLVDGGVDRWARERENASDHAPTWIMFDLLDQRRGSNQRFWSDPPRNVILVITRRT